MDDKMNHFPPHQVIKDQEEVLQTLQLLHNAVDTMSSYFLMWDQNDRLIICNEKVFELYPSSRDIYIVGRTFEEVLRMEVERGDFEIPEKMTAEQWIDHRLELHKRADYLEVQQIQGRWFQIRDQKTTDGFIITTAIDIDHLKNQK